MYPHRTVYSARSKKTHGTVYVAASVGIKLAYSLFRGVGAGLIAFVVLAFLFTIGPIVKEETKYASRSSEDKVKVEYLTKLAEANNISKVQEEAAGLGLDSYFSIYIPKIDAKSKVIANVDPGNEVAYVASLKEGVAHAQGTYFPGQGKGVYLFAHSTDTTFNVTRYNAIFYLLRELEVGDDIVVFFTDKKYVYAVSDKQIVEANDTSWLTRQYSEETLVLQTCWPPGTSWKRLILVARPKTDS